MYIMEIHTPLLQYQNTYWIFHISCDDDGKWRWKRITLAKRSNYPSGTLARCRRHLFETVLKQQKFPTFIKYKQLWDIDTVACLETVMYSWLINNVFFPYIFARVTCQSQTPVSCFIENFSFILSKNFHLLIEFLFKVLWFFNELLLEAGDVIM